MLRIAWVDKKVNKKCLTNANEENNLNNLRKQTQENNRLYSLDIQ